MKQLPKLPTDQLPRERKVASNTDLRQVTDEQLEFWKRNIPRWVRETATEANREIIDAGNPKYSLTEIDGKTGATRQWSRGRPGSISQASTAVRVRYTANALAMVANGLRPILSDIIAKRFPYSSMQRLQRDWVWYVVRRGVGSRGRAEFLGGMVNVPIEIYDQLYLVPDSPKPAEYAWFANNLSKQTHERKPQRRRKDSPKQPRDRRLGYLGEAVRRMRGKRVAGVVIWGMFIRQGMTAGAARNRKGLLPVVGVAFTQRLQEPVSTN